MIEKTKVQRAKQHVHDRHDHRTSVISRKLMTDEDQQRYNRVSSKYQSQSHFEQNSSNILHAQIGRFSDSKNLKAVSKKEPSIAFKKKRIDSYDRRIEKQTIYNNRHAENRYYFADTDGWTVKKRIYWPQQGSVAECFRGHGYSK